ncbi:alpha/beta hydrolase [Marinicauda salina]|uniref:Alpha/beta hydrolase n=2 Tax=Marinicauda salina TaxID=2135793 RepID=A0A2U2BY34_9PROT|nr:alpha/beta hydrolase [Marinicauda salina]
MPPARRIDVGEVTLSVHEAGPEDGPPVLLLHGWPELALSWASQIEALANAGYRVIAPDNRGFGASDAPQAVADYGIDHLVGDVSGLLDALGIEKAVIVGHDWGGILMWHAAMLIPERFLGVVGVNTPHLPRGAQPPTEVLHGMGGDEHYIIRIQDEALDDFWVGREREFFDFIFAAPPPALEFEKLPPSATHLPKRFEDFMARGGTRPEDQLVVPPEQRRQYAEAYAKSGFRGGFNWYRNLDANWERMGGVDHRLSMPCLMISAECDFMLPPRLATWMPALCSDLEMHQLDDIGHWTQYEAPDELNALLIDWIGRRFG